MNTNTKFIASIRARGMAESLMLSAHMDSVSTSMATRHHVDAVELFEKLADSLGYEKPVLKGDPK